jgi:hypothetical protein
MDGWMDGWVGVKAVLRIAYSNQKWVGKHFEESFGSYIPDAIDISRKSM